MTDTPMSAAEFLDHDARVARIKAKREAKMQENIRKAAAAQAKREAKHTRDLDRAEAKRRAAFPDRAVIIKALGMLRNDNDGETLNAARAVERIRAKLGLSWSRLIVQIVPPYDPGVE